MLLALALLQTSLMARPLYLDPSPPELRSAQHIQLYVAGAEEAPPSLARSLEETLELAAGLHARLEEGADFEELAYQSSEARNGTRGAVLGTFAEGMLPAQLDEFLFAARIGEFSQPMVVGDSVHILLRTDTYAAVRQIFLEGSGQESRIRAEELLERARAGEDFSELAKRHSDDPTGAEGGALAIFERGPDDRLLKKAAFSIGVGEIVGPIETPLGLHILARVPEEELDEGLREKNYLRGRAILIAYGGAYGASALIQRTESEALSLAQSLHGRILKGEQMSAVASEINDDPGGRARGGDLGWIHRGNPQLPLFMQRLFRAPRGEVQAPLYTSAGYVVLLREE